MKKINEWINKIICGDCVEAMKELPSKSIDLTVTSPPYDNLRIYKGYTFNFEEASKELFRIMKYGGIVVWVIGDETINFCESLSSFKQVIFFVEKCKFNLLDTMIYKKSNYAPAYPTLKRYANIFEYMFVLSKGKPKIFNPIQWVKKESSFLRSKYGGIKFAKRDGSYTEPKKLKNIRKTKDACNVWEYATDKSKDAKNHPAVFPEKLAEDHILTWSNENNIVLDFMCGSGTTCKMAKLNNRKFIGIEISKEYCNIASKRVNCEIIDYLPNINKDVNKVIEEEKKVDWRKVFNTK